MVKIKMKILKGKAAVLHIPRRSEKNKRVGAHTPRVAPYWWQHEVKGKHPFRVCGFCHAIYFDKHWQNIPELYKWLKKQGRIEEQLCFECTWIKKGTPFASVNYEGEVILDNTIAGNEKNEILNLVRNVGKRAAARDPEDQIIKIDDRGSKIIIRTTENQLAISIGKQVARAFKGGELKIKYSHEDAPVRVYWKHK